MAQSGGQVNPVIFHITHVDNLASIIECGCIWSDAQRRKQDFASKNIGLKHIKDRRMHRPVPVSQGGVLGDYVPFNFCPRSVMLYVVSQGHEDYVGGGREIVHLVSSFEAVLNANCPWAFTDGHAEVQFVEYFDDVRDFHRVDWDVMDLQYWAEPGTKHRRQAELLVHDWFPWTAVEQVGVFDEEMKARVSSLVAEADHQPPVVVRRDWYY